MARSPPFSSSNIGEFAKINTTSSLFYHFASNLSTRFFGAERVTFLTNPTFTDLNFWLIFSPAPKEEHLLRYRNQLKIWVRTGKAGENLLSLIDQKRRDMDDLVGRQPFNRMQAKGV